MSNYEKEFYKQKYLKYKSKYTELKDYKFNINSKQNGGLNENINTYITSPPTIEEILLDKKNQIQIGKGYSDKLKDFVISKSAIIKNEFNSSPHVVFTPECNLLTDEFCFNFNDINIENTLDEIEDEYKKNGYLYLRPYRGEKTLIIGCGNNRLDCSGIINRNIEKCDLNHSNLYHNHRDAYTLDFTLVANPSIVADFNKDLQLSKIPDNSFSYILFEGGGNPDDNPAEIQRLLNKYTTSFCIGCDEVFYIYSFWLDGVYIKY
jgi:hypothetical protein